jgi:C-terminal processing protease CtpA/Prc
MTSTIQSNPLYYSLATLSSGQNSSSKTVVLHKRADHEGFGIYIGEDIPSGLYIVTVERNSPASDANVQPGDRILAVNGELVSSMRTNPKEILVKAATNAQNLTLTIQSTNIFQTLNIPLTNSSKDNQHKQKRNLSRKKSDINTDLERYMIKIPNWFFFL